MVTIEGRPPRAPEASPQHPAPRRLPGTLAWRVTTIVALVAIAVLAVTPVLYLLWGTFVGDDGIGLGGFARAFSRESNGPSLILNSVVFALGSTVLAFVIGTGMAFLHVRTDAPFKGLTFVISVLPLATSPLLYATSWIFLASPRTGLFNDLTEQLIGARPFDVFSMWGMVWVQGTHLSPVVFLFMSAAFAGMDPSLEESAQVCGARRSRVFAAVTAPLLRPSMAWAGLLVFVTCLESFEIPGILGLEKHNLVFTSQIYLLMREYPVDYQAAGALSMVLLVVAAAMFLLSRRVVGHGSTSTITGKAFRPTVIGLGRRRPLMGAVIALYFLVVVALPFGILVYASLLPFYQSPTAEVLGQLTLDNYRALGELPVVGSAAVNTVIACMAGATIVVVLTTIASWFVSRHPSRLGRLVDLLSFAPMVVPGIVLGLSVSFVFLRLPIPVYGTLWIIVIAFVINYLPYGMRYANAALAQVSNELEESAAVSGASPGTVFRRILLPLVSTGVLAGWLFVVVVSSRAVSSIVILATPGSEVLSVVMWQQVQSGQFVVLAALGTVMTLALALIVQLGFRISRSFGVAQEL